MYTSIVDDKLSSILLGNGAVGSASLHVTSEDTNITRDVNETVTASLEHMLQQERSLGEIIIIELILFCIVLITIGGNLLVCITILTDRKLHTVTNYFILSLAFTDLLLGVLVLPISAYMTVQPTWPLGPALCNVYVSCDVMLCTVSILTLFAISLDRYFAVALPMLYHQKMRRAIVIRVNSGIWVFSSAVAFIPIHFGWNTPDGRVQNYPKSPSSVMDSTCLLELNVVYALAIAIGTYFAPLSVMCAVYLKILRISRRQAKAINGLSRGVVTNGRSQVGYRVRSDSRYSMTEAAGLHTDNKRLSVQTPDTIHACHEEAGTIRGWLRKSIKTGRDDQYIAREECKSPCSGNNTLISGTITTQENDVSKMEVKLKEDNDNEDVKQAVVPRRRSLSYDASCTLSYQGMNDVSSMTHDAEVMTSVSRSCSAMCQYMELPTDVTTTPVTDLYVQDSASPVISPTRNAILKHRKKQTSKESKLVSESKATVTLATVVAAFAVCWVPYFVLFVVKPFLPADTKVNPHFDLVTLWLGYVNSSINPFLYAFYNASFRDGFRRVLCRYCCCVRSTAGRDIMSCCPCCSWWEPCPSQGRLYGEERSDHIYRSTVSQSETVHSDLCAGTQVYTGGLERKRSFF